MAWIDRLPCVTVLAPVVCGDYAWHPEVAEMTPDWKHEWLHTHDPMSAFAVWQEGRWQPALEDALVALETDSAWDAENRYAYEAVTGRSALLISEHEEGMPWHILAYDYDPQMESLAKMREPSFKHSPKYHHELRDPNRF